MKKIFPALLIVFITQSTLLWAQDTLSVGTEKGFPEISKAWREIKQKDDSAFVAKHTDVPQSCPVVFHDGNFPLGAKPALSKARKGDVVGPFRNANADYLLRVTGKGKTCDSVQVSHILIAWQGAELASGEITRTKLQARKKADSLCSLISKEKIVLEDVVVQETDDPGSRSGNLGNYGWMTRKSGFIEVYKQAAFANPVGSTFVIESQFGFHIMQVEKKTREYQAYYAWQIVKLVDSCFGENGMTQNIILGGFPGGPDSLDKWIARERLKYDSIAKPRIKKDFVAVFWDVLPDGSVANVGVSPYPGLTARQETDIKSLFQSLPPFIPNRTCKGPLGQMEVYFLAI